MADGAESEEAARVARSLGLMPFSAALGVEVMAASAEGVTLEAPLSPAFEAPKGAFAASSLGVLGDMAAITAILVRLPEGDAMATLDFTVKLLGQTRGSRLRATGRALQVGRTTCVGAADIFVLDGAEWRPCGALLATGRRIDGGRRA